jgi:Trk-type K+ transport system membrane component
MSEELDSFQLQGDKKLPNESAVLVLGILSLVSCIFYGIIGLILGIIAIVLHKKDKEIYNTNPNVYERSFKNSNAGKICAIIGVSLSSLFIIVLIIAIAGAILVQP